MFFLEGAGDSAPFLITGMGIQELIKKFEAVQKSISEIPVTVSNIVVREQNVLLSLNRDQMLLGRNAEGEVLTPSYLDDPYFDNSRQAEAYANMKYRLESEHKARIENPTIYPDKDRNTPNLIVTGPFQDNMFILPEGQSFLLGSTYSDARDIEEKYHGLVFGIAPASKMFFYKNYLRPALLKLLTK